MNFNDHSHLEGRHAFLGASKHSWLRYDADKLDRVWNSMLAAARGTELHDFAAFAIRLGVKLERNKKTLNRYVNDAIGYRMTPEQFLYYSENCFGCADAISFRNDLLRIHDLKTGITPASFEQLEIYAALFCLEYKIRPFDIKMELRIYQNDELLIKFPEAGEVFRIMEEIKTKSRQIDERRMEMLG